MRFFKKILYSFCTTCKPNASSTVRYAFPLIFAFAALLGASAIVSENKSYIYLESSVQKVNAGEVFQIDVFVKAHVPVNALDVTVSFPKDQISILGIDTGESVITLWTQDPYVKGNQVFFRGGTFRKGFVGDHKIATINARAVQSGLAQFAADDVVLLAGDGTGSKVSVTKTGEEETSLYIAQKDGTFPEATKAAVGLKANANVLILTDVDGDGRVTLTDISRFMTAWSAKTSTYDFNGDGSMTFRDFGIILADSFLK